jgi:hypothetical protein
MDDAVNLDGHGPTAFDNNAQSAKSKHRSVPAYQVHSKQALQPYKNFWRIYRERKYQRTFVSVSLLTVSTLLTVT